MPDISFTITLPVLGFQGSSIVWAATGIFMLYWVGKAIISIFTGG